MTATATDVLNRARGKLGTVESPPSSNHQEFGVWYGFDRVPWCAIFVSWCMAAAGAASQYRFASVAFSLDSARKAGRRTGEFRAGFVACRINDGSDWGPGHTGIVEAVHSDGSVTTIEGNTSPGAGGSQRDGGGVWRRRRLRSYWNKGCIRIDFGQGGTPTPTPAPTPAPTPPAGRLGEDGDLGPATVSALQRRLNDTEPGPDLAVDGDMGQVVRSRNVTFPAGTKTQTARYLQQRLNAMAGPCGIDGEIGPQTIKALQRHVVVPQDGQWGPQTTVSLQRKLNQGTF